MTSATVAQFVVKGAPSFSAQNQNWNLNVPIDYQKKSCKRTK